MDFVKILLGLIGLGIVVFIHELGHFLAARSVGIDVEAFSIGWGKPILKKKVGAVEYRLGMFPLGGYCKMRGENDFAKAWENTKAKIPPDRGTFLGSHPAARMLVAFAGPLFNIIFAAVVFSVIWGIGFEYTTMDNRIVLLHDVDPKESYPADQAGLLSGDRIISINGDTVENFYDMQKKIIINAKTMLHFTVLRNGETMEFDIKPVLESTGAGKIGVFYWADPVIDSVEKGSAAEAAGLQAGDRILKINGEDIQYSAAFFKFTGTENNPKELALEVQRDGATKEITVDMPKEGDPLGFSWKAIQYHTPNYSFFGAIGKGFTETGDTLVTSVRSLGLLFQGIDLTKAISGPVRITYMAGDIATAGFEKNIGAGLRGIFNFLALISIALAVMNLLPLPILDGGLILIFFVELFTKRPVNPRFISIFQTAGIVLIAGLMLLAVFGDILFFVNR